MVLANFEVHIHTTTEVRTVKNLDRGFKMLYMQAQGHHFTLHGLALIRSIKCQYLFAAL